MPFANPFLIEFRIHSNCDNLYIWNVVVFVTKKKKSNQIKRKQIRWFIFLGLDLYNGMCTCKHKPLVNGCANALSNDLSWKAGCSVDISFVVDDYEMEMNKDLKCW